MSLARAFTIAASGLSAQRTRMETVASNLANMYTTRTAEGGPYRRKMPVFAATPVANGAADPAGRAVSAVRVSAVIEDPTPPLLRYQPGHPDANPAGLVAYPNVEPIKEMTDMVAATRSYEANVTTVKSVRTMANAALDIVR